MRKCYCFISRRYLWIRLLRHLFLQIIKITFSLKWVADKNWKDYCFPKFWCFSHWKRCFHCRVNRVQIKTISKHTVISRTRLFQQFLNLKVLMTSWSGDVVCQTCAEICLQMRFLRQIQNKFQTSSKKIHSWDFISQTEFWEKIHPSNSIMDYFQARSWMENWKVDALIPQSRAHCQHRWLINFVITNVSFASILHQKIDDSLMLNQSFFHIFKVFPLENHRCSVE